MYQLYVTFHSAPKTLGLDIVLIPLHSPLLGESLLVSFPSLNNMLKFSECSRLIWGQKVNTVCVCFNVLRSSSTHEWRFEMDGRARASDANNTLIDTHSDVIDLIVTLRQALSEDKLHSAICVQNIDVQCVLQFTLTLAFCCVLHRHMSRVIHR